VNNDQRPQAVVTVGVTDRTLQHVRDAFAGAPEREVLVLSDAARLGDALLRYKPAAVLMGDGLTLHDMLRVSKITGTEARDAPIVAILQEPYGDRALGLIEHGVQEIVPAEHLTGRVLSHCVERARVRLQALLGLEAQSLTDALTGVLNRRGFFEWGQRTLRDADRTERTALVLLFDMNGLKTINDRYGHRAGDTALQITAYALRQALRTSDILGRIGGDEFAVLALGAADKDGPIITERVSESLRTKAQDLATTSVEARGWAGKLSTSAGWAEYQPGSGITLEALLDGADVQLYAVKAAR